MLSISLYHRLIWNIFLCFLLQSDSDAILSKSYDFLTISIIYGLTNLKIADIILIITVTKL